MKFETLEKLAAKKGIGVWEDDGRYWWECFRSTPAGVRTLDCMDTCLGAALMLHLVPEIDVWGEARAVVDALNKGEPAVSHLGIEDTANKLWWDAGNKTYLRSKKVELDECDRWLVEYMVDDSTEWTGQNEN